MKDATHDYLEAHSIAAFEAMLADYGFEKYALTHYFSEPAAELDLVSKPLLAWHHHFHEQRYDEIDSVGQEVKQGSLVTFWNLFEEIQEASKPMQRMIRDALDAELTQGVSLLLQDFAQGQAILVLHHPDIQKKLFSDPKMLFTIHACAKVIFEKNQTAFYQRYQTILTHREREILQYSIHHTVNEIAKKIHRTPRTVIFHLNNAKEKLQTNTKTAAIYRALQLKILDPKL